MLIIYILLGILVLVFLLTAIAPKKYEIKRSVHVNVPLATAFQYIKFIKNQDEWSPWKKKDPDMKQDYVGEDGTVGFISKWEGTKDVGVGEQEITKIVENDVVEVALRFFKPWKSESVGYMSVKEAGDTTEVTWGFRGTNKVPFNVLMLFMNMEKAVGKDFEEGLAELKVILEKK